MPERKGIIVFTLWYLFIAFSYIQGWLPSEEYKQMREEEIAAEEAAKLAKAEAKAAEEAAKKKAEEEAKKAERKSKSSLGQSQPPPPGPNPPHTSSHSGGQNPSAHKRMFSPFKDAKKRKRKWPSLSFKRHRRHHDD